MTVANPLLAYYDTISAGLVPVRITGYPIEDDREHVEVIVTALRWGYKKGDRIVTLLDRVVSRQIRSRSHNLYVNTANHQAAKTALEGT